MKSLPAIHQKLSELEFIRDRTTDIKMPWAVTAQIEILKWVLNLQTN